ncbi:MAG: hypothetical protein MZW92_49680 [Comamonadaceae bacterium]|nr:hypothetical protein [Comamonadaceae bacterium]
MLHRERRRRRRGDVLATQPAFLHGLDQAAALKVRQGSFADGTVAETGGDVRDVALPIHQCERPAQISLNQACRLLQGGLAAGGANEYQTAIHERSCVATKQCGLAVEWNPVCLTRYGEMFTIRASAIPR